MDGKNVEAINFHRHESNNLSPLLSCSESIDSGSNGVLGASIGIRVTRYLDWHLRADVSQTCPTNAAYLLLLSFCIKDLYCSNSWLFVQ
jgi:hypothetical protein